MRIDIHRHTGNRFIAIPANVALPESWAGARYFKTIDLEPTDIRIGMKDASAVLDRLDEVGWVEV